jgi:hypothetical protein
VLPKGYYEYVDEIKNKKEWYMYPSSWLPPRWVKSRGSKGMGEQEMSVWERKNNLLNKLRSEGRMGEYKAKNSRKRWKKNVKDEKKFRDSKAGRTLRASGQTLVFKYLKKW